jgi:predicted nucleic acid-binding protein
VRIVLDTNTLVSGLISAGGPPRRLVDTLSNRHGKSN